MAEFSKNCYYLQVLLAFKMSELLLLVRFAIVEFLAFTIAELLLLVWDVSIQNDRIALIVEKY